MVSRIAFIVLLLTFIGCSQQNRFPILLSEKVVLNAVQLTAELPVNESTTIKSKIEGLNDLLKFNTEFQQKSKSFKIKNFQKKWVEIYRNLDIETADLSDLQNWFEMTGLLFELTGEASLAAELERLALSGNIENDKVASYVFTKNVDHIFTNIYTPAKIEYNHTTGGDVIIELVSDYPKSGKVDLNFTMTDRRYIELNIRIPDWAEGTTVTVKRVKYFAPPGGYCKIAKKWKDGDIVEIQFQNDRIPDFLKTDS